ncbi:MAG TPA: cytidine/deoxycytidylate deaminase family protein [Candidatus Omnitrophota bacterium]|nr:cytidine/deoxycytidylate deaminase family protein [Candidatus Omnitrophota bacterium]HPS19663.1 cytidine/deoxycytidylate deaminase family protein [Candidatus Omnitrophota bacterium]
MKKSKKRKTQVERLKRPAWDEYFSEIAKLVAKRSTCLRRNVGAVAVKNKQILATGYNGAPSGIEHCEVTGCIRQKLEIPSGERHELCRALHAEQNALLQAARHGVSLQDATMYITTQPCSICAKMMINAGIKKIVFDGEYPDKFAMGFLREAGIEIVKKSGAAK